MKRARGIRAFVVVVATLSIGSLLAASGVIGKASKTVVKDGKSPHDPGGCDIVKATSALKNGVLRHTVTTRGKRGNPLTDFTVVVINHSRSGAAGGSPEYLLDSSNSDAHYRLTNHRKTAVFTVEKSLVADAVDSQKKYFWKAVTCASPGDSAPSEGAARQALK